MVRFWLVAVVLCAACASCGGAVPAAAVPPAEEQDLTGARSSAALDAAELHLEEEGLEDADTAVVAALSAHGYSGPDAQVLDQLALRAELLATYAAARPGATADQLFELTAVKWEALASSPAGERVDAVAKLLGFDAQRPPEAVSPEAAQVAATKPELGLDARGRLQLHAWRSSVLLSISQHLDLSMPQATARALALEQAAQSDAKDAALSFTGLPAASFRDPSRAAGRALRFAWRSWADHAWPDEAWPMVAHLLGVEEPPVARAAPPDLTIVSSAGLACAVWPTGVQCSGTATSSTLQLTLDGRPLEVLLPPQATAATALDALLTALPASAAGCVIESSADGTFALARLDRSSPPAPANALLSQVLLDTSVSPPLLTGMFANPGSQPRLVVDYSGNELRILVQPVANPDAGASFRVEVPLPSRLPHRRFEAQVVDADNTLRAAAPLDRR